MRRTWLLLSLAAGCTAKPATPSTPGTANASLGEQMRRQDEALVGQKVRTLLDFETKADSTFVSGATGAAAGHTGLGSVHCGPTASINISSLLFGLRLPAAYTLVGGYVKPAGDSVTAVLVADGVEIARTRRRVPPGTWALAAIDLTTDACRRVLPTARDIRFVVSAEGGFDLDDVVLIDNLSTLVDVPRTWVVTRSGLSLVVADAGRPARVIPTLAAGDSGWAVDEVSALRIRLHDSASKSFWTLFPSGMAVMNGRLQPQSPASDIVAATSADIKVDEPSGRLDLETEGDANNDGYNERRGAFQVVATARRIRFTLLTHDAATFALVEVRGLPRDAGRVVAAGDLIESTARLPDGTLLVRLPIKPDVPIEVTIGQTGD